MVMALGLGWSWDSMEVGCGETSEGTRVNVCVCVKGKQTGSSGSLCCIGTLLYHMIC